ncbi:hypothetical protein [Cryptosporangium sp. NPDC051539]|uniref:hypothetical protein n=1 Tax=Cryptosporangium sp. NPDC051539 TaxID=3363962 RepID=UPI0037B5AA80
MNPLFSTAIGFILIGSIITLGYAFSCWVWPFKACHVCHGSGRRESFTGRAFRACKHCRGTGARLRAGRWIYNQLSSRRREGVR